METRAVFSPIGGTEVTQDFSSFFEAMSFIMNSKGDTNTHWTVVNDEILMTGYYGEDGKPSIYTAKETYAA